MYDGIAMQNALRDIENIREKLLERGGFAIAITGGEILRWNIRLIICGLQPVDVVFYRYTGDMSTGKNKTDYRLELKKQHKPLEYESEG